MADTLVRAIVHIDEERLPVGGQRRIVDGIAMVLRGDEALGGAYLLNGLVVRAMTVFQFISLGTGSSSQELVTQTDTHARTYLRVIEERADMLHRSATLLRIARTISQEQTIELELVEIIVPRHTHHLDATLDETTDDIGLDTTVDKHYALER
jgi:hypothetical protein